MIVVFFKDTILLMDFVAFLKCLSYPEKKDLLQLLQKDLAAPENETLRNFLQRAQDEDRLPTRLRTIYANALWQHNHHPASSPLDKPVKEITYENLYIIKGMGPATWKEFVALRGY